MKDYLQRTEHLKSPVQPKKTVFGRRTRDGGIDSTVAAQPLGKKESSFRPLDLPRPCMHSVHERTDFPP